MTAEEGITVRERFEDAALLAFKMEEESIHQRTQAASKIWKGQGNKFSPELPKRTLSC